MFKNYLKIAIRNLLKHRAYSAINVLGLAVGISACLLIMAYVVDELNYDQYHTGADRIYRGSISARINGKNLNAVTTCAPLADALAREIPEVEASARLYRAGNFTTRLGDKSFNEDKFFHADASVFRVFTIPLVKGNAENALTEPYSMILSERMAEKYFGNEDPMGKVITTDGRYDYKITGVFKNVPAQSHVHFDFLASFNSRDESKDDQWLSNNIITYVRLKDIGMYNDFQSKMQPLVMKYAGPQLKKIVGITMEEWFKNGGAYNYVFQPITSIHLHSQLNNEIEPNGNIIYVYIFSVIAVFILLIACINFMNLATARSSNRAKEVGVRKALGSMKSQLMHMFLTESVFISLLATAIAIGLAELFLPAFNDLTGKGLEVNLVSNPLVLLALLLVALLVGLLAGSYPAFYLSAFDPIAVLKGKLAGGAKGRILRSTLVVMQFSISVALIIGTLVIRGQIDFVQNKKMGFDKEHVLVVDNIWLMRDQRQSFKQALMTVNGVEHVTVANGVPGQDIGNSAFYTEGHQNDPRLLWTLRSDFDIAKTLKMEISEGRDFSNEFATDSTSVILNEAAVKVLGLTKPLAQFIYRFSEDKPLKVIGVVKDFNFQSLHQEIQPLVILPEGRGSVAAIRIRPDNIAGTVASVEKIWNQFQAGQPFVYSFLDEDFDALYRAEQRVSKIISIFAGLAIFIACLGLLGLAAYTAEQRTKEIGIRKVLGASAAGIVALLSKEFLKWVLISNLIAWPLAYYFMNSWLENFAYRIDITMGVFVIAGGAALCIALLTVSLQAFKAASANPVEALKYE
ncbi:FtsX-like permease family protein [bacterium]|nr:MAG: FtsX-like permease family protein [bacterium]